MTKRILIAILAIGLTLHVSGCSSSGSKEEGDAAVANDDSFAEEGEGDFAQEPSGDGEVADGSAGEGDSGELANNDEAPVEDGGDDLSLDDAGDGGDQAVADNAGAQGGGDDLSLDDEPLPEDIASSEPKSEPAPQAAAEPPPTDEPVFTGDTQPTDSQVADTAVPPADTSMGTEVPPADGAAPSDVASTGTTGASDAVAATGGGATPGFVSVKKIKDAAFNKSGTLLNRVYLARPGDTIPAVSTKIYGSEDRAKDLLKWNGHLKSGVKTGDKVYYSSPRDPNDTRLLTYYEDLGLQPSVYVSKEGDNIRKVSKQLLGSPESWKEVWATNMSVESKGDIPAGVELRYWPEGSEAGAPAPVLAQQPSAPPAGGGQAGDFGGSPATDPMHDPMAAAPPPPTDPTVAMNDPVLSQTPPGPGPASTPDSAAAAGAVAPPPPSEPLAPPPPPPPEPPAPPKPTKKAVSAEASPTSDPDTIMAIGFGGILLIAAAVLFVVIRKNRAKRIDLGQTQV